MRNITKVLGLAAALYAGSAQAVVVAESGDAGETLASAQVISGAVDAITGTLTNRGTRFSPVDDIDMFRIFISNTSAFGVTVTSDLSFDNDSQLFLFNSLGQLVASNDDGGPGLLAQFNPGVISGLATGNYYLAFNLYNSDPTFTSGGVLSGWDRNPGPYQTGSYTLNITGAAGAPTAGAVPEPATWLTMILGIGAVGFGMRRRGQTARLAYAAA